MDTNLVRQVLEAQRDLYLEPSDEILFVVDDPEIIDLLREIPHVYPYEVVIIPKLERPGQDYELDESRLEGKTVGWLITQVSASHSPATKKMLDRGMFLISNPGITPDWPAILDPANREPCRQKADAILAAIGGDVGGEVWIEAKDGTRLFLLVPNGNWQKECGEREGVGTNGLYGEVYTAPYSAFGVFVLNPGDFLTNPINEVTERIELRIARNKVEDIHGGKQADQLREMLSQPKNWRAFSLGEFSFGINPAKPEKLCRSVTAEKLAGGFHIAIGSNAVCLKETCPELAKFYYGRYSCGVHVDCIKFGGTVVFRHLQPKGTFVKTIVDQGKLIV